MTTLDHQLEKMVYDTVITCGRETLKTLIAAQDLWYSQSTVRSVNLLYVNIDPPKLIGLVVSESVHRSFGDVETLRSGVNTKHVNALLGSLAVGKGHFPTCTTAGRIKACDGWDTTDIREVWQTAEGCEAASKEAIWAIWTSDSSQAGTTVIVGVVPAESRRGGERNSRKGGEGGKEFHDDDGCSKSK